MQTQITEKNLEEISNKLMSDKYYAIKFKAHETVSILYFPDDINLNIQNSLPYCNQGEIEWIDIEPIVYTPTVKSFSEEEIQNKAEEYCHKIETRFTPANELNAATRGFVAGFQEAVELLTDKNK